MATIYYDGKTKKVLPVKTLKEALYLSGVNSLRIRDEKFLIIENGIVVKELSFEEVQVRQQEANSAIKEPISVQFIADSHAAPLKDTKSVYAIDDPDFIVKIINNHNRQRQIAREINESSLVADVTSGLKKSQQKQLNPTSFSSYEPPKKDMATKVHDDILLDSIIRQTKKMEYEPIYSLLDLGIGVSDILYDYNMEQLAEKCAPKNKVSIPRRRSKTNISLKDFLMLTTALAASLGITIGLWQGAKLLNNQIEANNETKQINISVAQIEGFNQGSFNFVNNNKVIIPGSFNEDGSQAYWLDTVKIAKDILNIDDKGFNAALFYSYITMGKVRNVASYHNWDEVIAYIATFADSERNPRAFMQTSDCKSFSDFLIKNGYVDENGLPNENLFIKYGLESLRQYADDIEISKGESR